MSKDCAHTNPLIRGGTSHGDRFPVSLNPDYAKVDEKNMLDLLAFIKQYSGELSYYQLDNKADGTWEVFFRDNIASRLADIATFDIKKAIGAFMQISEDISAGPPYKKPLKSQFDLLFTLMYKMEMWSKNSLPELLIHEDLLKEISSTLSLELLRVVSYYKKAVDINLVNPDHFTQNSSFSILPAENILQSKGFSSDWFRFINESAGEPYAAWSNYFTAIEKSDVYEPTGNIAQKAKYSQSFLIKSLERITSSYKRLAKRTDAYIDDILNNYASHEPHIGLLLAFLNLFRYAQDEINTITARHLDFYLKDVLQLDYLPAVADKAHIIFEPAKGVDKHKVKKDTALSAGKDSLGKEILFHTREESIINKAQIDTIKNIYIGKQHKYHIFACPVANSSDGIGAEFEEDPGKWKPFGEFQSADTETRSMPDASPGFMITADILLLKEGQRKITIDITCESGTIGITDHVSNSELRILLSGEKGWIERKHQLVAVEKKSDFGKKAGIYIYKDTIRLNLILNASDPPVVKLDAKLHDMRFNQNTPGVFVECLNTKNKPSAYNFLRNVVMKSAMITVSAESKSDFTLQNDQVVIDPSKPFMPFGPIPKVGASFIIGSSTIFNSKLTRLILQGKWNNLPDEGIKSYYNNLDSSIDHESFTANRQSLNNREWAKNASDTSKGVNLFKGDKSDIFELVFHNESGWDVSPVDDTSVKYDINSKGGYIKIELDNNNGRAFGHNIFPKKYAEQAIKESAAVIETCPDSYSSSLPNEPYTPVLSDFSLSFKSEAIIKLDSATKSQYKSNEGKIFQVFPFGYHEVHPFLCSEKQYLLPRFTHVTKDGNEVQHNGQLIIGLKDMNMPSAINLLFKVAEGSEDPELQQQEVIWFYLADDKWVQFLSNEVLADNTRNLTTTGILSLSIPKEATDSNYILPGSCIYIMGAIEKNTAAACQIIDIHPQALLTEFKDKNNDPSRTSVPLPAGTIAKLKVKDEKIKSVSQPYASFGGKMQENSNDFYLRTAERLRHKSRGISVWDYERLILQAFPDIYKAKCINHTAYGYYQSLGTTLDAEFAPGYVTLILIPTTYNQYAINPYEPKVTKARILDIEKFIKNRISTFAAENLKVLNPLYEQIQLEFEVEFHQQYADRGFYEKQLNEDIKQHLSPWAYAEGKEITLGNRLHRSTLIDFVEELYYVDYVKDFMMHRYINNVIEDYNIELVLPSTARSAFVTLNDKDYKKEHKIKEISE